MMLLQIAAQIGVGTIPPIPVLNLDGSGLRIDWTVTKAVGPSVDDAQITVYNLDPALRATIAAAMVTRAWALPLAHARPSRLPVQLYVGWAGTPLMLFQGEAWRVEPEVTVGTDIVTIFEAGDGGPALFDTPPAGGSLFGVGVQIVVQSLLTALGFTPSPTALALIGARAAALPPTNYAAVNDPKADLDAYLASLGLSWGIADGFFVVYESGIRIDLPQLVLSPDVGGLLSWAPLDDGGMTFEALADPGCVPGRQVVLLNHLGAPQGPPMRVESISFNGSTNGPSIMSATLRKVALLG